MSSLLPAMPGTLSAPPSPPSSAVAPPLPDDGVGRGVWLVTPGVRPDRFVTAAESAADIALVDLEDSVRAVSKDTARDHVVRFLRRVAAGGDGGSAIAGVRVNALSTVHGLRDLARLAELDLWPPVLLVPKVESAREVELVGGIMSSSRAPSRVWALIETPRAVQNLPSIVRAAGLAGVVFGAADYAAEVGCAITSRAVRNARIMLVSAVACAGVPAVDSPFFALQDLDGLRKEAREAAELGFVGKVALHPAQVPVIRTAFEPSHSDLETARAVIRAADNATTAITTVDGVMVGPPIVAAARALTARIPAAAPGASS